MSPLTEDEANKLRYRYMMNDKSLAKEHPDLFYVSLGDLWQTNAVATAPVRSWANSYIYVRERTLLKKVQSINDLLEEP